MNDGSMRESGQRWTPPLTGRVAVVTGGAAGIGLAVSRRLARDGASVAVWDLDESAANRAVSDIERDGGRAIACTVDVADRSMIDLAVRMVHSELGKVSILVNNAGIEHIEPFLENAPSTWERIFAVNTLGTFHCTQAIAPDMVSGGWGRIINISSSSAQRGAANMVAYSASKGAIISFTRSLALSLGRHGITVNNIPPNFIVTPMLEKSIEQGRFPSDFISKQAQETPVGRSGSPDDIASACAFLASPEAGYITAQTFGVNGGRFP